MLRITALLAVIFISLVSLADAQQLNININSPVDKTKVNELPFVEGTVSDSRASVVIIVHPMEVGDYWVQQNVTAKKSGAWKVQIHIGRPGTIDVGKKFEIMAAANPRARLAEGNILRGWPEAQARSDVVEVERR